VYEITRRGAWLRWSSLDATEKALVVLGSLGAIAPAAVLGASCGDSAARLAGQFLGGGAAPGAARLETSAGYAGIDAAVLFALVSGIVSAIAWWRLSARQDELFNRIQNYAVGRGAACALGVGHIWWLLSAAGAVPPVAADLLLGGASFLILGFYVRAVRRWA
jgi:hypothetical protein